MATDADMDIDMNIDMEIDPEVARSTCAPSSRQPKTPGTMP
jgi:hypothetical protein